MKIFIAALALAATAFGVPVEEVKRAGVCTPGTYSCTPMPDSSGWRVCDVSGNFVVSKFERL